MATQAQRTSASRARLIAAARDLVASGGSARASLRQIGEHAGMSRGAVNFHFGTKAALLDAVFADAVASCEHTDADPSTLADLLDHSHRAWFEDPARARLIPMLFHEGMTATDLGGRGPMAELCRGWRDATARSLSHLQRGDSVRSDIDAPGEAALIVGSLIGLVAQNVADPAFDCDEAYAAFRGAAMDHLGPHDPDHIKVAGPAREPRSLPFTAEHPRAKAHELLDSARR